MHASPNGIFAGTVSAANAAQIARSIEMCDWKDRILQRLESGSYHGALLLCRQAVLECLGRPSIRTSENVVRIKNLEWMLESLIRGF